MNSQKRARGHLLLRAGWFIAFSGLLVTTFVSLASDEESTRVRSLIDAGRYDEAQSAAERLLANTSAEAGSESEGSAGAGDLLVEALLLNGRGGEATSLALATRVIQSKESRLGSNDPQLAISLRNLGDILFQAADYSGAIANYDRALSLRERDSAATDADIGEYLDHLARALTRSVRYQEARRLLDRSLSIKEASLATGDIRIARTLEGLGWLLQRMGEYAQARRFLERALSIRDAAAPDHPEIVGTLNLLGDQCWFEGALREARQFYLRALETGQKRLRADHPDLALTLRNFATTTDDLGGVAEAKSMRTRALAIMEKNYGPSHLQVAGYLNDLAESSQLQGDYPTARVLYERALKIKQDRLGPDHLDVATTVYNLAELHARLGDFAESRRLRDRAVAIWRRKLGPEHPYIALAFSTLGEVVLEQGQVLQARSLFEQALAIRERSLGPNHPDVAVTLAYLAKAFAGLGARAKAEQLSARAVDILERANTVETPAFANVLTLHADIEAEQGHYDAARRDYEHALLIRGQVLGTSHPEYARTEAGLALALVGLHESATAVAATLEAESIARQHLRLTLRSLPERQSLDYAAMRPKALDLAVSVSVADKRPDPQVLDALIRSRALVLDEMAERRRVSTDVSRPDIAPLWTALTSARQRLANLVVRGPSDERPQRYAALVEDARRDKELAERALADKSTTFRNELRRGEIGLNEVREALPPHSALLAFALYDRTFIADSLPAGSSTDPVRSPRPRAVSSYVAFVITADRPDISVVPLGSAAVVDALVARWRGEITNVLGLSSGEAERTYRAAGTDLRRRVWDPIASHLNDASTVFLVPDGTLNLVSFAALPVGQTKYLIDQGSVIHYLAAERDLVMEAPRLASANHGLLAVGGAAFDDSTLFTGVNGSRRSTTGPSAANTAGRPATRASCGDLQSLRFDPLVGTTKEVHDVARLWTELPAQVLEGHEANERAFKNAAPGHRVLHLATHGFFLESTCLPAVSGSRSVGGLTTLQKTRVDVGLNENPLLLSGLALAGANRRASAGPNDEDGILTAEEVAGLNLDGVEWAVLSACDTGLGAVRAGEGVLGLRRAFQLAGAQTVIMSLWPVDDKAAQDWMRALYVGRLQKHLSTANAMRQASLSVLGARRAHGESTHPFYWSAFVAVGDWR